MTTKAEVWRLFADMKTDCVEWAHRQATPAVLDIADFLKKAEAAKVPFDVAYAEIYKVFEDKLPESVTLYRDAVEAFEQARRNAIPYN